MAKILVDYENDCVGCPQGCVNCGRNHDYPVYEYECDECKDADYELELFKYKGKELCKYCLAKEWLKSATVDEIFNKLWEWECLDLLADEFEKVEMN